MPSWPTVHDVHHPLKRVAGKSQYLEATRRFYSMVKALEIKSIVVEGDRACVLTRYELSHPARGARTARRVRGLTVLRLSLY